MWIIFSDETTAGGESKHFLHNEVAEKYSNPPWPGHHPYSIPVRNITRIYSYIMEIHKKTAIVQQHIYVYISNIITSLWLKNMNYWPWCVNGKTVIFHLFTPCIWTTFVGGEDYYHRHTTAGGKSKENILMIRYQIECVVYIISFALIVILCPICTCIIISLWCSVPCVNILLPVLCCGPCLG